MNKRISAFALFLLGAGVFAATLSFAWGVQRYGSSEDFFRRIDAEIEARRPHPQYAPTPLAPYVVAGITNPASDDSAAPEIILKTLVPTVTPQAPVETAPAVAKQPTTAPLILPIEVELQRAARSTPTRARPTATATASPRPPAAELPARVQLAGLRHNWQTWNNCGPATLAMNMSYFGSKLSQADVAAVLRPYKDDKNVNPEEMAAYAREQDLQATVRVNGDAERLRRLLAAGVPVLIETWYEPKPNDGMGHYRLLVGYDDAAREWIVYDSYDGHGLKKGEPYAGIRLPYDEVTRLWEVFNRVYVVLFDEAHAPAVQAVLGPDADNARMWAAALEKASVTALAEPDNAFAWFNAGSTLVAQERYVDAAQMFDRARQIGLPWRMMWYQYGPFKAYYETGRYDEVIALADATLRNAQIEELYYWRGLAEQAQGDAAAARTSWQRAVELNTNFTPARDLLQAMDDAAS